MEVRLTLAEIRFGSQLFFCASHVLPSSVFPPSQIRILLPTLHTALLLPTYTPYCSRMLLLLSEHFGTNAPCQFVLYLLTCGLAESAQLASSPSACGTTAEIAPPRSRCKLVKEPCRTAQNGSSPTRPFGHLRYGSATASGVSLCGYRLVYGTTILSA